MTITAENLRESFIKAAVAHVDALDQSNHRRANQAHDRVIKAIHGARDFFEDHGHAFLKSLSQHENPKVRGWAATYLLPFNESLAIVVLEEIAETQQQSWMSFDAKMVLELWRDGKLKLL